MPGTTRGAIVLAGGDGGVCLLLVIAGTSWMVSYGGLVMVVDFLWLWLLQVVLLLVDSNMVVVTW